jgi:hypothetical protein
MYIDDKGVPSGSEFQLTKYKNEEVEYRASFFSIVKLGENLFIKDWILT